MFLIDTLSSLFQQTPTKLSKVFPSSTLFKLKVIVGAIFLFPVGGHVGVSNIKMSLCEASAYWQTII